MRSQQHVAQSTAVRGALPGIDVDRDVRRDRAAGVVTERARAEVCSRVGEDSHSVAQVARDFGVSWATAMAAVREYGRPLVDDPHRLDGVPALGVDETALLAANGALSGNRPSEGPAAQADTQVDVRHTDVGVTQARCPLASGRSRSRTPCRLLPRTTRR